jgi:hypothetical protein
MSVFLMTVSLIVLCLQWSEHLPLFMSVSLSMEHLQLIKESRYKEILLILSLPGISLQTVNTFFFTLNESGLPFWNFKRPCYHKRKVPERVCFLISLYWSYWCGSGCSFSSMQSDHLSDHLSFHHTCILNDSLWLKKEGECFFKMSAEQTSQVARKIRLTFRIS